MDLVPSRSFLPVFGTEKINRHHTFSDRKPLSNAVADEFLGDFRVNDLRSRDIAVATRFVAGTQPRHPAAIISGSVLRVLCDPTVEITDHGVVDIDLDGRCWRDSRWWRSRWVNPRRLLLSGCRRGWRRRDCWRGRSRWSWRCDRWRRRG